MTSALPPFKGSSLLEEKSPSDMSPCPAREKIASLDFSSVAAKADDFPKRKAFISFPEWFSFFDGDGFWITCNFTFLEVDGTHVYFISPFGGIHNYVYMDPSTKGGTGRLTRFYGSLQRLISLAPPTAVRDLGKSTVFQMFGKVPFETKTLGKVCDYWENCVMCEEKFPLNYHFFQIVGLGDEDPPYSVYMMTTNEGRSDDELTAFGMETD